MQLFGGRGASAARNGKTYRLNGKDNHYGDEYTTLATFGNVKVVKANNGASKSPQETQSGKDRIYATVDDKNRISTVTFYDNEGKRTTQIDLTGKAHNGIKPPHTHLGYKHSENGFHDTTQKEWKQVYRILRLWKNYNVG